MAQAPIDIEPAVFTLKGAATYLHSNEKDVRRWLLTGELVGWRTKGTLGDWRISKRACDEWIAQQEAKGMEVWQ